MVNYKQEKYEDLPICDVIFFKIIQSLVTWNNSCASEMQSLKASLSSNTRRNETRLCCNIPSGSSNRINDCRCVKRWNVMSFFSNDVTAPSGPGPRHYRGFTITLSHITLDRTPLDEWSARRRDLYLTTHNTHKTQTSMPPAGLEPAVPTSERRQTHASDRAASGIGTMSRV
jgi:hypothetical protein